jgi:hypothetical protein
MDAGILTEQYGPLPVYGWMLGGGAILAVLFLLRGGSADSAGASSSAATQPATQPAGASASYLAEMLKSAQDGFSAQLAAQKAEQAATVTAQATLLDQLKAQLAAISAKLGTAGPIAEPIGQSGGGTSGGTPKVPSDGRVHGAGAWTENLYYWQVRDVFTGSVWDKVRSWRDVPEWALGNIDVRGATDAIPQIAAGTQTGYGFVLPFAYNRLTDRVQLSGYNQGPESAWSRTWRRFKEYMSAHPNADPAEALKLQIRRTAGDALNQGYSLNDLGFDLAGALPYTAQRIDLLRSDEQLVASGMHLGTP